MTQLSPLLTQLQAAVAVLAQVSIGPGVETEILKVKSTHRTFISKLLVCNRGKTPGAFRISISLNGAPTNVKDYLYYDFPIAGNETFSPDLLVTLGSGDVIRVTTTNGSLTYTLLGMAV